MNNKNMKEESGNPAPEQAMARFAEQHIAPARLFAASDFPWGLWREMGQAGLLGVGIPGRFGGMGGGYEGIARCGRALAASGRSLGLSVSWMIHVAAAAFLVDKQGTGKQKEDILPRMATGEITLSLSISEPKTGAHPKHMKTTAARRGDAFVITGEKTYLTNGPIADVFAVVAVTDETAGQKRFSAFLVPKDTPGLTVHPPMTLDFFRPSPHGGVTLDRCTVPASAMVGVEGAAYGALVKPFRDTEDILMMGPVCGGLARLSQLLAQCLKGSPPVQDKDLEGLGLLLSLEKALFVLALEGARQLDSGRPGAGLEALPIAFRRMARLALEEAQDMVEGVTLEKDGELTILLNDLVLSGRIARGVSAIKQRRMGEKALTER